MDETTNLKWGIIFSYVTMVAGIIVSLTYTPFLLNMLGQQQYGLYNMGQAAVSYLGLTEFGFGNAVVRYASKYRAEGDIEKTATLYGMFMYIYNFLALIIFVVGTVICIFSSDIFTVSSGVEGYRQLRTIIMIMVINLVLTFMMTTYSSIIIAYEKFTFAKITNLIYTVLKPLVMIPLLLHGYKAVALSAVTLLLMQGLNMANVFYVKKILKVSIDMKFKRMDFGVLKEIIGYSFFIFLGTIVAQLNDNADKVILGIISGEKLVAVYTIGYQLSSYMQQIPGVISSVFFPRVTMKIAKGASLDEMTTLLIRVGRIQCYFVMLLLSGFVLFGKEFVFLWAGPEYEIAYWIVLALIIPATIPNMQSIGVQIIQAKNKHQFRAILYVVCAVFNVGLSVPMGMRYGALGCAVCTGFTTFITCGVIMNWYYKVRVGLDIVSYWKNILSLWFRMLPVLFVGLVLNLFVYNKTWMTLFGKILIYTCCYGIYSYLLLANISEKKSIRMMISKLIRKD